MAIRRYLTACLVTVCAAGFLEGLAPVAAAAATDPPRITFPPGVSCPAVVLYAVRGSGEAFDDSTLGAGAQLKPLYDDMVAEFGANNVGLEASGYPAVPVIDPWLHQPDPYYLLHDYKPSVLRGVADAVADITAYVRKCPKGALVIAGYSQGADVVRRALAQIPSIPYPMNVQVILYGDPNFSPSEDFMSGSNGDMVEHGDYKQVEGVGRRLHKLAGLPAPPAFNSGDGVQSWCHGGDPVCQFLGGQPSEHVDYAALNGYAAASYVSGISGADWRIPVAITSVDVLPVGSQQVDIMPGYFPPVTGPNKGKPSEAFFVTTVDGRRVDGRWVPPDELGNSDYYTITLPDQNWHVVSVYALGHLMERKRVQ